MNANSLFYASVSLMGVLAFSSCKPQMKAPAGEHQAPPPQDAVVETADVQTPALAPALAPADSMVLVHAVSQPYDYRQPWNRKPASYYSGFAVYLGDRLFLTTASIVDHSTFIELLSPDGSKTAIANVKAADYEANLAILELAGDNGADFLQGLKPVELADDPSLGQQVQIWQFNDEGVPIIADGIIESTQNNVPLTPDVPFVLYQIKSAVNPVTGGATMPVMIGGKLAGISLNHEASEQRVLSLTAPTIKGFLERARDDKGYQGLPSFGARLGDLMDPVLRRYLKLPEKGDGVYVLEVAPDSSAGKAGIRAGDVIVSVNGKPIDGRGIVHDEKLGPVNSSLYLHDLARVGEVIELGVQRGGKLETVKMTMNRESLDHGMIPGRYETGAPAYIVHGGLVFQPLTRTFISEVFEGDPNKMPLEVLDVLDKRNDYRKEGRKQMIVISNILPTAATHGYGSFAGSVVRKINGVIPRDMKHLAELIDSSQQDVIEIETNKPPFVIYFSTKDAAAANDYLKKMAIPELRSL